MRPTLCVVDMQDWFSACPPIALEVAALVKKAIARQMGIVVLEYIGCGETNFQVSQAYKDYDRVVRVTKSANDGSREFIEACLANNFSATKVFVCGVYTDQCVRETIEGIRRSLPKSKIALVASATRAAWTSNPQPFLETLRKAQKVKIVQ